MRNRLLKFIFLTGAVIAMLLLSTVLFLFYNVVNDSENCFHLFSAVRKLEIKFWLTSIQFVDKT